MTSVWISILNQGEIRPELSNLLLHLQQDRRFRVRVEYPSKRPIANNRNDIVSRFKKSKYEYLLMIDADTVPLANPLELALHKKDVIACPVPQWNDGNVYWVVMDKVKGGYRQVDVGERSGLKQVDAVGTGCIMIHRKVLEKIKHPFEVRYDKKGTLDLGLDFHFCEKARRKGFEIWVDWTKPCDHHKKLSLLNVIKLIQSANN